EQMGHRGLWADGWKITTYHEPGHPFDDDEWGLYNLDDDFSECHDLAAEHPDTLRDLIDAWWVEAGHHGVLPLDDRSIELFGALQFDYNALGTHHRVSAPVALGAGRYELVARFERVDKGGRLTVAADGDDLATIAIPKLVRMLGSTGLDVGRDALSPVVDDYE